MAVCCPADSGQDCDYMFSTVVAVTWPSSSVLTSRQGRQSCNISPKRATWSGPRGRQKRSRLHYAGCIGLIVALVHLASVALPTDLACAHRLWQSSFTTSRNQRL